MKKPTKQEKIDLLQKSNPSLSFADACLLLGFNPNDPEIQSGVEMPEFFKDIFNGKK